MNKRGNQMNKKERVLVVLACVALLIAPLVWAGQNQWFYTQMDSGALNSDGSGATMAQVGTGVSLIGVIDNYASRSEGLYSLQPGAWKMGYNEAFNTTNTQSTGSSNDSAVTIEYRYGLSNRNLTKTQWENKGESGTTLIAVWTISGTSDPVEFYPEAARYVGIFAAPGGGPTQFCVPTDTWVVWQ